MLSEEYIRYEDLPLLSKGGRRVEVEFISNLYQVGDRKVIQCNIRDITESLRAKAMLIASHDLLKNVMENTPVRVFWKDSELRYLGCNTAFAHDAGMSTPEDLIGKDDFQMGWKEQAELYRANDQQVMDSGIPKLGYEEQQTTPDGRSIWIRTSKVPLRAANGDIFGMLGIYEDITERKQAEENLKLFRTLLDNSSDAIEVIDSVTFQFIDVNETTGRSLGYSREELLSMHISDIDPEAGKMQTQKIQDALHTQGSITFETHHRRKDGSMFPVEVSLSAVATEKVYLLAVVRDISDRKQAEKSLSRANRALRTLSAGNEALVRATNENALLKAIANVIVEQSGYELAEVCYSEDNPEKSIRLTAWGGKAKKYFWEGHPSWADTEEGQLPMASAIRSGTTQIRRDLASESLFQPWREAALAQGYVSNIALPLSNGNRNFGALSIYSSEADAFDDEEVRLLEELANDLAYGIVTLRTRKEHEQHATILRQSMEQSIQTIAATVEARDPYTAGHQKRVSELAKAIAHEMGLTEDQVNGIHFAAIIHDLGKIRVPAEILSKPGKLTKIEFALIQQHPQEGYDILKNVQFPWPIADIILQHHEKLDGTGYPQGLKGDQILLESRILTVADVVEAMSSHRPYRAALGIGPALDEIRRGRDTEYDPVAVDVCLKLFDENRFAFSAQ